MKKGLRIMLCLVGIAAILLSLILPLTEAARLVDAVSGRIWTAFYTDRGYIMLTFLGVAFLALSLLRQEKCRERAVRGYAAAAFVCGTALLIGTVVGDWASADRALLSVSFYYPGRTWDFFLKHILMDIQVPIYALCVMIAAAVLYMLSRRKTKIKARTAVLYGAFFLLAGLLLLADLAVSSWRDSCIMVNWTSDKVFIAEYFLENLRYGFWVVPVAALFIALAILLLTAPRRYVPTEEPEAPIVFEGIWTFCTVTAVRKGKLRIRYEGSGNEVWIPGARIGNAALGDRFRVDDGQFEKL